MTSRLQLIRPGDQVLVSRKPTGTLVLHDPFVEKWHALRDGIAVLSANTRTS